VKKFGFTIYVHLFNVFIIILGALSYFERFLGLSHIDIIPIFIVVFAAFNQINILFACSIVYEDSLTQKSLIRKVTIPWNDIRYIKIQPSNILVRTSIGIFGSNKKINITSWTKNYKELLRLIIAKSNSNSSIKIDPLVLEKLKIIR
jgi:hypothetical protein